MKNSNLLNRLLSYSHEKRTPQRLRRYAVMLLMILTLGVGQMWGASEGSNWYDASSAKVYFDNTNSSYSNVSILIGRQWNYDSDGVGSSGTNLTKVSGTNNLYYASVSFYKYTTFCFIDATNWGWEGNKVTARCTYASHYTNTPNDNLGSSTHLYVPASGSNNASVTHTTPSSYTALNYTQTLSQKLSTDGGSTFSTSTASIATVKVESKELNGNSSTTKSSGTISAGSSSTTCSAARTATVTYTVSDVTTGYTFVGWYDGDTQKSTSTTYTYNATGTKTITARFTAQRYSITYKDQGDVAFSGSHVDSPSAHPTTHTYGIATSLNSATKTGYTFGGWFTTSNCASGTDVTSLGATAYTADITLYAKWTPVTWQLQSTGSGSPHGTFTGSGDGPYTLDVTYNSSTMNWGAARFDLNGTSYICNNYTIGTSGKLDLRAANAYTGITGMTNGKSYTFTITYENATWYVQIEEAAAPCTTPTIAWNTTPANGVAGGNMTASVTTNQTSPTITWNSSNTSVATVNSSGVITYVAAGNTRITASYTGDGSTYCSTTASVYQDITVSAAVADAWSLWYWGESETKIGDFTPDGGDSHHLDFELTASNFQTLWLKNNSTQYVATNINANTVTNVTVTESPTGRFRDDATKGYYRFTIYKDGGGAWKLDASPIYRVTYNDNGATSGTAPTDAAGYASGATVTVKGNTGSLAKTGYDFGGWNLAADGSGTNYTAGSGTFSITANTELFAKWNAQNYSIIYKDQGDVAFSGSHVDSPSAHPTTHTYGAATTLNSAIKTGYTFGGWFTTSNCASGTDVTSLEATAYTSNITLYAKWTEIMSDLSTSCHYDAGTPGYAAPTVSGSANNVGYVTTRTITATAAGTGYTFAGWTLTNCTRTDGGGATANPITIRSNGDGAAVSVVANYNEDLSSPYTLKGGTSVTGDNWATAHNFTKKTGHSTESVAYCTFNVASTNSGISDPATNWSFKVLNGSTWYGLTADGDSWWYQRNSGQQTLSTSGKNIQLCADVAGPYEIKVDYTTPASPKVTVTFPTSYTLTYAIGSVNGTSGTISTSPSTASGSKVLSGTNVTLTGPAAKSGYTWKGWYTNAAGTEGKIADTDRAITVTMNANKTLYACYNETMHTVTVAAGAGGSTSPASVSAGIATKSGNATATPNTGYVFTNWALPSGTSAGAGYTLASNPIQVNATADSKTITANFAAATAFIEGRFHVTNASRNGTWTNTFSAGDWDENSTRIKFTWDGTNSRYELHTYATPAELTSQISSQDPVFYIKESSSSSSLANVQSYWSATSQTLSAAGTGNKRALAHTGTLYNNRLKFNSSTTNGYVVIYFDEAGIWYELEQRLQYNANGGSGAAPTGANGHNSYHATGTNATAAANTFTARAYYTFGGWNTNQYITGANYAVGDNVPMSADVTLYAKWTRSVTLNQEDATTEGSTSVVGTYNCATLPAITNPSKNGYVFDGWYTETAGNGNLVINTSGELQASKYHWTDASGRFDRTTEKSAADLYAKWTQTVTLNANTGNHGFGDNTSATIVYKATAKSSITHCTPATGYHLEGYYTAATDGVKVLNADGSFASSAVTDYITDGKWTKAGATTLYAHYEPNTYDVILDVNGATSGSNQTVTATFDAAMPTTQKTSGDDITAPSKTGYTFGGYYANTNGTGTQYYTNALASNHIWDVATNNTHIYAKWTANPYTITLTQSGETGYGSAGTASVTATYDAALPTISSLPTAANGYAFMGYYTDHNGEGTQYYDATGTKLVASYTTADALELFAYFKKAEVTGISFSPAAVVAPNTEITATPTIDPDPVGPIIVCWELQYNNGTPLPSQPTFTPGVGNAVSFNAPAASATYRLQATLKTGSSCAGGTELSVYSTTFQVAGEHTVTVRYQDSDGRTLQASSSIEARPLTWTTAGDITPPTITGYTFARWDAGDGVSIKNGDSDSVTTTTTPSIQIKAVYDGTLTAVYNKKNMIFFNNTLGWSDVYVYFYSSDKYWVEDHIAGQGCGTGSDQNYEVDGSKAYYRGYHGHMTQIAGTNIWYYDYEAEHGAKDGGEIKGYDDVVFVETEQNNYKFFYNNKAARRGDFKHSLPMFVPINSITETKNGTKYYSSGYWMNYPENTGYSLLIYNQKAKAGATKLYELPFEYTEDKTMPMELVMDLEAGQTYGFEIKRADGNYYSKDETVTANKTGLVVSTGQSTYCGLQTTAAGDYKFSLYYSSSNYRMDVTYPVAVNDYRIVYTDLATWSKDAHTASWSHPSRVITKNSSATETKKDTVSFFWSYGSSPAIKYQQCTATGTGSVTWNAGTAINVSSFSSVLTKKGVYNFIFEQPAGGASISLVGVEPYTGNYYIRTDCAGSTKWANFSTLDHQMTYSDYAEVNSGYSHYYTHWVTNGTNVKFCIANDYSQCISDTLAEDYGTVIANINAGGTLESGNASIRFMWNQATNKISRAYISGSTNISDRFLVLEGDAKMYDENGNSLNITGLNANEINLVDDQNFVYERTIQVNTGAKAKLTAKYNNNVQYFKGGAGTAAADSVELLGGEASGKHTMRIVYDFKTNRLVTAYVPSGTIEDDIAINADLMIVRNHQEAGQQLLFNGGSLSEVHTVYGVMRFNRWTLNNKETTGSHDPVGDPKSAYERALYWISFPFDVNLSDVFGFGTYGTHWIIMEYDGAERAQKGYWKDSKGFWKYVTNRNAKVLEAGKGYVLALDLDLMKYDDTSFWSHNIEQVELFFPSASVVNNISETNVQTTVDAHECKIDRTGNNGSDINKNRTKADSHWNMIGIPSYANYGTTLKDGAGGSTITWNSNPYTNDLPFLYEWNMVDNTYTVQSGTTYPFKSMHAYMVQYHGNLYWSLASATPVSPIVARRTYADKPQNVEMRIELQQNEKVVDQTFVKLSNDENVSTKFAFDEDLCKEYNANKANIYTFIEGYIPAGGNTLPMTEQTMVVPVGVQIAANGDYTFAIPEGTEGIGITLIDNETGIRTSLSALDYTINLPAGTYNERFLLEISPIRPISTDLENTEYRIQNTDVRKVLIDGILYIVKDGVMYDARGSRVQ